MEPSSPSSNSSSDLTSANDQQSSLIDQEVNQNKSSLKRRLSLFLRKSSLLNETDEKNVPDNENQSIRGRLRSFSLLNSSNTTDFFASNFMNPRTNKPEVSKQVHDDSSSLDDDVEVNLRNLKLVLNKQSNQVENIDENKENS